MKRSTAVLLAVFLTLSTITAFAASASSYLLAGASNGMVWSCWFNGSHMKTIGSGGDPTLSQDGRWLAYASGGNVYLRDLRRNKQILSFPGSEPSLSPDGSQVVYNDAGVIKIRSFSSGSVTTISDPAVLSTSPSWGSNIIVWKVSKPIPFLPEYDQFAIMAYDVTNGQVWTFVEGAVAIFGIGGIIIINGDGDIDIPDEQYVVSVQEFVKPVISRNDQVVATTSLLGESVYLSFIHLDGSAGKSFANKTLPVWDPWGAGVFCHDNIANQEQYISVDGFQISPATFPVGVTATAMRR